MNVHKTQNTENVCLKHIDQWLVVQWKSFAVLKMSSSPSRRSATYATKFFFWNVVSSVHCLISLDKISNILSQCIVDPQVSKVGSLPSFSRQCMLMVSDLHISDFRLLPDSLCLSLPFKNKHNDKIRFICRSKCWFLLSFPMKCAAIFDNELGFMIQVSIVPLAIIHNARYDIPLLLTLTFVCVWICFL